MRILVYSSLYPAYWSPIHGTFVKELVRHLSALTHVTTLVPENGWRTLGLYYASHTRQPGSDTSELRCRFWTIPKLCKGLDASLMALCTKAMFEKALHMQPDLVHAHYAYPDAAAAAILARQAKLPLVVTCHGSDLNVLTRHPTRRAIIARELNNADAVVTVSPDLADKAAALGVAPARIHIIANGVDIQRFTPGDKTEARRRLGLHEEGPLLLAVGRLEPVKGYDRLLKAISSMSNVRLILAGQGSLGNALQQQTRELRIVDRVRFAGPVPHDNLAVYFQAADCLVISSHSEGWPTVIHEALACGTPVVAPAVGGIPTALADHRLGIVLPSGEAHHLCAGIRQALDTSWEQSIMTKHVEQFHWHNIAKEHIDLYNRLL
jgi:glycosyltransferase involved in cell wall biosynthesis